MRQFSGVRANVIANFAGKFSSALLAIVFTPLYIHFLGIEAYGLIGFYITLQASLAVLEMGLKSTCIRELAQHSARGKDGIGFMRDTLRSLEVVYWAVALLIGVIVSASAPWIASHWLNESSFSNGELTRILWMMAWVIALRWPVGFYTGALMGLQRQVLQNVLLVVLALLNWGGSVLVLWLVQADIEYFFGWQLLVSAVTTAAFGLATWRAMPGAEQRARFSLERIRAILPFAAGVGSNAILGTILLQADKLILSATLPLDYFGYYVLASMIAGAIVMMVDPIYAAVYPRFSQLLGKGAFESEIVRLYHVASQTVSVLVIPMALLVALFSPQVLLVYTGDTEIADMAAIPLSILVIAKMLHAMMYVPYALQLSSGWVRLSVYINIVSVCWLVPAVYLLSSHYGMTGAAVAWLVVTLGYVFAGIPMMHRRLLKGEWRKWMSASFLVPLLVVGSYLLACRYLLDAHGLWSASRWMLGAELAGLVSVGFLVGAMVSTEVRKRLKSFFAWLCCRGSRTA